MPETLPVTNSYGARTHAAWGVVVVYEDATVAVVVPAYNEAGFVGSVVETIPGYVDRIYVVDDGSTDDTWAEITATAERVNDEFRRRDDRYPDRFDRRVVAIQHPENRGVGGAIKTGYLAARDDEIAVTAVMGGDAQMRPDLLEGVIRPVVDGEADYVKGNRLVDPSHHDDMPRFRYVGNRVLTWLTRIASGYWTIGDPQNGYTAISLHALETAGIEEMYEYYGYCNDLLVRLSEADLRVLDVPRPVTYGDEESSITYRAYIPRVSGMLFRSFLRRLWRNHVDDGLHPVAVSYGVAGVTGIGGTILAIRDRENGLARRLVATVALSLVFILTAFAFDSSHRPELDGRLEPRPQRNDDVEDATTSDVEVVSQD